MSIHVSDIYDCFYSGLVCLYSSLKAKTYHGIWCDFTQKGGIGTTNANKTNCLFLYCPKDGIQLFTMYITDECFLCFVYFVVKCQVLMVLFFPPIPFINVASIIFAIECCYFHHLNYLGWCCVYKVLGGLWFGGRLFAFALLFICSRHLIIEWHFFGIGHS